MHLPESKATKRHKQHKRVFARLFAQLFVPFCASLWPLSGASRSLTI